MKPYEFYRSLHGRGVTLDTLARDLGTTRSHLSAVFTGSRGAHSRKHIAKLLTPAELTILGWQADGSLKVSNCELVPHGTSVTLDPTDLADGHHDPAATPGAGVLPEKNR